MKIARISELKNLGVFRDFKWPSDLPHFARYNVVYGWNGTGKTTLSNILLSLQMKKRPGTAHIKIDVDGKTIREDQFETEDVPLRVFNREFIDENIFTTSGEVAPIFVLGEENVERQKLVEQYKVCLVHWQSKLGTAALLKTNAVNELEQYCTTQAASIKRELMGEYINYDKRGFKETIKELFEAPDIEQYKLNDVEKESLRIQLVATEKPNITKIVYTFQDGTKLNNDISRILKLIVTTAVIESLRDDPDLSSWIKEGLEKHQQRKTSTCLFCGMLVPEERIAELNAHFNDEYNKFIRDINEMTRTVQALSNSIDGIECPDKAKFYNHLANEYETSLNGFLEELKQVQSELKQYEQALERKKEVPFESLEVELPTIVANADKLNAVNEVITKHNSESEEFSENIVEARKRLEKTIVADCIDEYNEKQLKVETTTDRANKIQGYVTGLKDKIAELERDIVHHREPAEELNSDLCSYLGHGEIALETKDTGYRITRNGVVAKGLSEGEKTAIALLYFLKSLKDRSFDLDNGIVMLDDPVSSLDSNCLYCAFGFIKDRTEGAGQLIILTHNFSFFDQVRNWFRNLRGRDKKEHRYYMLDCRLVDGERCSQIKELDPLLKQYNSEYHYIFKQVHDTANDDSDRSLEQCYMMPNVARRLLETFLAFRYPGLSGGLWSIMQQVEYDNTKKTRIMRFLDTHSHSRVVGEREHDASILGETKAILKDLLDLMKTIDEGHFTSMVSLLVNEEAEGE